jgi:LytS/YehU family sensor histidine kinase
MQVRLGDRLVFRTDVDPVLGRALVPHFILQPLVENALQHGVARRAGAGSVTVGAERRDESLVLVIQDDGPGPDGSDRITEGIGLSNTRRRLERLYGSGQRLVLSPVQGGGMRVELVLPYREADS